VDPVTGLSRRQLFALGLVIPLGVVASTVATFINERVDAPCPDKRYECTSLEAGEPVIIGLLDASDPSAGWPVEDVSREFEAMEVRGHPVHLEVGRTGCSPQAASEFVRELASDPPDSPPATLVVAGVCDETAIPLAQILSDSGISLVALNTAAPVPTDPPFHLLAPELDLQADVSGLQGIGLASHLRQLLVGHIAGVLEDTVSAVEGVGIREADHLLIPRTALRNELISEGFPPA
jgi:hypothetical protein